MTKFNNIEWYMKHHCCDLKGGEPSLINRLTEKETSYDKQGATSKKDRNTENKCKQ